MPDAKISALTAASTLGTADVVPVVQAAANRKATGGQIVDLIRTHLYAASGAMARTATEHAFRRRFMGPDGTEQVRIEATPGATEYWRISGGIAGAGAWLLAWADAADDANAVVVAKGLGTVMLANGAGPILDARDTGADKQMDAPVIIRGGATDYTTHPGVMAPNLRALWLGIGDRPIVRLSEDIPGDADNAGWRISAGGGVAKMAVEGAATNIPAYFASKGTGGISFGNTVGGNMLFLQPTAGVAVNVPYIQPGVAGQPGDIAMNPANNVPLRLGVLGRTNIAGGFIRGGKLVRNAASGYANITLDGLTSRVFIDGAGTIAAAAFTMPPSASLSDGQEISFTASQTVTALTLTANTAQTLVGAPTTMNATTPFALVFDATTGKWTRV